MAADRQVGLRQRERPARRHLQLPCHQVQPGDHLGDRMLDLQARVHLQEVEGAVGIGDELHRAGADIADRAGGCDRRLAHRAPPLVGHAGGGCLLDHLLVAPLHRAVALEKVHHIAVRIGKHLDLDVPRLGEVLFHQHRIVAEACCRLALAGGEHRIELVGTADDAHALAAAARACLDQYRIADARRLTREQRRVLVGTVVAGYERHAGLRHQSLGFGLQAHRVDGCRRRADEYDARIGTGLGERLVLGQEAIAGMDRLRTGASGHIEDHLAEQVRLARRRRADAIGDIGHAHVACAGIGVRIDRDSPDAEPPGGGGDAAGDLAAVGDQQGVEMPGERRVGSIHGSRLATSSSMTSVAPPPIAWMRASRAIRSMGVPRM